MMTVWNRLVGAKKIWRFIRIPKKMMKARLR